MEIVPLITKTLIGFTTLLTLVLTATYILYKIKKKNKPQPVPVKNESVPIIPRTVNNRIVSSVAGRTYHNSDRRKRSSSSSRHSHSSSTNIYPLNSGSTSSRSSTANYVIRKRHNETQARSTRAARFDITTVQKRPRMTVVNHPVSHTGTYDDIFSTDEVRRYYKF